MFAGEFGAQSSVQLDEFAISSADVDLVLTAATYSKNEFLNRWVSLCAEYSLVVHLSKVRHETHCMLVVPNGPLDRCHSDRSHIHVPSIDRMTFRHVHQ